MCRRDRAVPSLDVHLSFQVLRHHSLARRVRRWIYFLTAGRDAYPLVFRRFGACEKLPEDASANLYIHVPFCRRICPHCPYNKVLFRQESYASYRQALERELQAYLDRPDIPQIQTLYFGGGTPSMTPDVIKHVIALARPRFAAMVEVGVEVHPQDATLNRLTELKSYGVNRISLGIETLHDDLLRELGRGYTAQEAERAIERSRAVGFDCVDVNLIYGIPGQGLQDSIEDVRRCIALGVDHISAYPLITFEHTPLGKMVRRGRYKAYGLRTGMQAQQEIARICLTHGFKRSSVWSFTRGGASAYTTVTRDDYVGFGPGAGSKVGGVFWFNTFSVPEYNRLLGRRPAIILSTTERFRRAHWLYWQIYSTRIDTRKYMWLFHRSLYADFRVPLALMRALGWTAQDAAAIVLTEKGVRWAHRIQMLFSLTFIDEVWTQCRREPWPKQITLM